MIVDAKNVNDFTNFSQISKHVSNFFLNLEFPKMLVDSKFLRTFKIAPKFQNMFAN